jgi:transposase-like protein
MDPHKRFCHNERCWAYARAGKGHIVIHSQKEQRYRCKRCAKTFSATKGTALYRMHKPARPRRDRRNALAYGCPPQAIVAAFGLDERTIYRWQLMSGHQCRRLHEHIVQAGGVLLAQVQADELRVRVVGGVVWLASALSVTSRLWLGGVVQIRRDRTLIRTLLEGVRACGTFEALLLCTDGLAAYPRQALKVFSKPLRTGKRGRPRLLLPEGLMVAQAIKRYARRRVIGVLRRVVVRGTEEAVDARLVCTQGSESAVINTAYIERLQATLRSRLAALARRTRAAARQRRTLEAGMWLIGTTYNFCCWHRSLRLAGDGGAGERRWIERTPAQDAGLTDHRWSLYELLVFAVPPTPPKRRGRRPRWLLEAAHAA